MVETSVSLILLFFPCQGDYLENTEYKSKFKAYLLQIAMFSTHVENHCIESRTI